MKCTLDRVDITLSLNLPQDLIEQATSVGLLTTEAIERWLIDELDHQRRLGRFFGKLDRLAAIEPPITPEEIDAEIESQRQNR